MSASERMPCHRNSCIVSRRWRRRLAEAAKGGLERSCRPDAGRTCAGTASHRFGAPKASSGWKRISAARPSRRTVTTATRSASRSSGVQSFRYRGEQRHCLPGQCHVLHPDELHDGGAGTDEGFGYRIVYIDPALIQQALAGRPLPFVADPVVDAHRPCRTILPRCLRISTTTSTTSPATEIAVWCRRHARRRRRKTCEAVRLASPRRAVAGARRDRRRAGRSGIRWTSSSGWPASTAGRWRGSSALPSAPAPAAFARCASWIACAGC